MNTGVRQPNARRWRSTNGEWATIPRARRTTCATYGTRSGSFVAASPRLASLDAFATPSRIAWCPSGSPAAIIPRTKSSSPRSWITTSPGVWTACR